MPFEVSERVAPNVLLRAAGGNRFYHFRTFGIWIAGFVGFCYGDYWCRLLYKTRLKEVRQYWSIKAREDIEPNFLPQYREFTEIPRQTGHWFPEPTPINPKDQVHHHH
eukprot:TRINITY_DN2491_c0_g1_i1.p2 TRINITY_DN2491_c0_g1~~TRINITY_DN2491_c0_g1_i1.p2  ORF type:complete len:115 (+),score=24.50 TRINITY_DN2491_c0_g1_i1:22-345(+)